MSRNHQALYGITTNDWDPYKNMACAVLVRALKDASSQDPPPFGSERYVRGSDKCTFADKSSAVFFLYEDMESLRFWVRMAGIRWRAFRDFLANNKLDSEEVRVQLKLGSWDKIHRVQGSNARLLSYWGD